MPRFPLALALLAASCGGTGAGAAASATPGGAASAPATAGAARSSVRRLQATLDRLGAELAWRSPGTQAALAVTDLASGARASLAGEVLFVSASSAKVWWVAAALHHVGVAAVEPMADPIFIDSDNGATGEVIDLVGPDRVNDYIWNVVGMRSTALTHWNYHHKREATNSPHRMGSDNYTTANDALVFLERLQRGAILDRERSAALLSWMKRSPRSGLGGWLLARLPPSVRAGAAHKAGWLDPGCCSNDRTYNTLNEVGIVTVPGGATYAVAILTHAGDNYWGRQVPFVEYASCEIYRAVAGDPALDCRRPGDPTGP